MRAGAESCLERRRREEHAARQRGPVPVREQARVRGLGLGEVPDRAGREVRSEEHTSELQSQSNLVCRLLLEKKKNSWPLRFFLLSLRHRRAPSYLCDPR